MSNRLIKIQKITPHDDGRWDDYVTANNLSTIYHLSGWRTVIERTYGHATRYLAAVEDGNIRGICPLVHIRHPIFGNTLYSIPYFDLGGILADDAEIERALLDAAIAVSQELGNANIELRQAEPLALVAEKEGGQYTPTTGGGKAMYVSTQSQKVRMILDLPETSDELMQSFKTKFRTKVRLPAKKGCTCRIGSIELVDDFYNVFCINMRDLGSPVHSKALLLNVMEVFADSAKIFLVDKDEECLAAGIVIAFRDMLFNPWASSLKSHANIRPNTHLYWKILEYACDSGFRRFDFGRSDPGGNTYVFKEQWGAKPVAVHWHQFSPKKKKGAVSAGSDKTKFDKAIHYWMKLPMPVANWLGPQIRKYIGL